jgi:hypothetical protein
MGLRSSLRNGFSNPSSLPSWWSLVGGVGIVVFVLYAAIQAIPGGGDETVLTPPSIIPITDPTAPVPTTPATPSGVVSIADGNGGTVSVPAAAATTGEQAAHALFSGDLSAITLAPGSSFPSIGRTWPDPQVSAPVQAQVSGSQIRLVFDVDPDGPGREVARRVGVDVVETATGWAVRF